MGPVRRSIRPRKERGIALVAAVLVVLLSTLLLAAFMSTTTGERSLSSNVQTAKMSLYAADAGIRTEQQRIANFAKTKMDSCVTAWNNAGSNTNNMIITSPATLFPVTYSKYSFTSASPSFSASGTIAWSDTDLTNLMQTYYYRCTIQSTGAAGGAGTRRVQSTCILQLSASRGLFSDYLMFMNSHTMSDGSAIWFTSSTTFDGRTHTNGKFHFAYKPTFQDLVTSVNASADYFNGGGTVRTLNANNNGTIDVPVFNGGFQRNQPNVPLPTDAYSQLNSALTNAGSTMTTPTNTAINAAIGASGSGTPATGIYVPSTGGVTVGGVTTGGVSSGGIYVQGDLTQMKMWADTTANKQWYQLTQGATVKTILVDRTAGQTKIWNSATTTGTAAVTLNNALKSGVVYVEGGISDLRGPDRSSGVVLPALAEGSNIMVTAQKDIVITRDVTDDSYAKQSNVLGIMTVNGGVRIGTSAPADINIDAFIMATATNSSSYGGWSSSSPGQFCVDSYDSGNSRGTCHVRGGIVEQYYGPFFTFDANSGQTLTGFSRDFHYDRRGMSPVCYPTTPRFGTLTPTARTTAWKEI